MSHTYAEIKALEKKVRNTDLTQPNNLLMLMGISKAMKEINYNEAFNIGNEAKRIALKQSRIDPPFIETYYRALLFMAQEFKQFDSYLMYIERNRDPEKQFYLPRRDLLMATGVIQALQRMLDDELDILSVSMPPRVGKTSLGEFFISFVMGHYPDDSNLMSSFSGFMTRMFYDAVLNIIKSGEYMWQEVFPEVAFESTNAKEETINLGKWKNYKTLTCRPIRGSLTGVTQCEGYLYVDDLVSGIEEAMSKDRLDKLYNEYTTDLKTRKKGKCKEIHIATRWSVHDVIGRIQRQYEGSDRVDFIAIPDIDPETQTSNFAYKYGVGFDINYFNDMEMSMDDISYRCLYKSDPIEREGILYHPDDLMRYFDLPSDKQDEDGNPIINEPDAILAICDTKDTGKDYNSMPVFYQYGQFFYLEDVVFKNIDPGTLDQLNSDMLVKHKVQQAQFESNKEGSRTANEVEKLVKAKGGITHITKKYTTQNKETKIIVNSDWVKKHVYFKDASMYEPRSDYGLFMAQLCSYTQLGKNSHDDAPDSMAMFALFVQSLFGGRAEVMSRADLGI